MPRRESYLTDDEDDAPRRGNASGGGIPTWLWVGGGVGVGAVLLLVGLGFSLFTARQGAARREAAHAAVVRTEVARPVPPADVAGGPRRDGPRAVRVPQDATPLDMIAEAYRTDRAEADRRYKGQRLRVAFEVGASGDGWVAPVGVRLDDRAAGPDPNVVFQMAEVEGVPVADGTRVVVEGTCTGLAPDPRTRVRLTFTDCRVVTHDKN